MMDDDKDHTRGAEIVAQMEDTLNLVFDEISFEMGFNGEKHELILTPEGDEVKLFELVYFRKHAPKAVSYTHLEPGEDAQAQALDAVAAYTQTFNKMGFIETEERDEIYMALRGILDALPDNTLQKDALIEKFEQLRDF